MAAVLLSRPVFVSFTLAADFKFMRESFSENDHKWIDWPFGTVRGEMPASGYVASKFHLGADLPVELDGVRHDAGVYRAVDDALEIIRAYIINSGLRSVSVNFIT